MNKGFFFVVVFSMKLCLCEKRELLTSKDSNCCNEILDLSKLIIKQTYIISFNTFFFDLLFCSVCFLPQQFFFHFSVLCALSFNLLAKTFRRYYWKEKRS